jgi:hypothetical protein
MFSLTLSRSTVAPAKRTLAMITMRDFWPMTSIGPHRPIIAT